MRASLVVAVAVRGAARAEDVLASVREDTIKEGALPVHYDLVWHEAKARMVADGEEDADARFSVLLSCSLEMLEVGPETERTVIAALDGAGVVAEVLRGEGSVCREGRGAVQAESVERARKGFGNQEEALDMLPCFGVLYDIPTC